MASDRARVSYDPSRKWRGVIAQQGRVTVEADWNEAAAIDEERERLVALDLVGPLGTPDGGYAVSTVPAAGAPHLVAGDFTIGKGTLYVGGERLELIEPVTYSAQPDWLDRTTDPLNLWVPPAVPSWFVFGPRDLGPIREVGLEGELGQGGIGIEIPRYEIVYLLAVEQEVSAVEDAALADVALGGPDTMQRWRILQRFVRARSPSSSFVELNTFAAFIDSSLAGYGLQFDPKSMMVGSSTQLLVAFSDASTSPSLCQPAASGGYLGADNQLIRVMVTSVDGEAAIVWGFDDASFLYRVESATFDSASGTTTVALTSAPVDSYHFPVAGQAVELLRDSVELTATDYIASATGYVSTLAAAYDPTAMSVVIAGELPSGYLSGPSETVDVTVTTSEGTSPAVTADLYTFGPAVAGVTPPGGPVAGGTTVTVNGSGFTGATAVNFGANAGSGLLVASDTQLAVTVPAGAANGTVDVTVVTPAGTSPTVSADQFTYGPAVTGVAPPASPLAGGTTVTLTGTGFTGATSVNFGANAGTGLTVVSDTEITVTAPAGAANGTVAVTVVTPTGPQATASVDQFTYGPAVTGVDPAGGPVAGGTNVTVAGSGFTGATGVNFGANGGSGVTVVSDTEITVTTPAATTNGTVDVTVVTSAGTSPTVAADQFIYGPAVTGVAPTSGPVAGATAVTVTGSGFTGATVVTFGTIAGSGLTVVSDTEITVTAPAATTNGPVDVTVTTTPATTTTPAVSSATVPADQYTYGPAVSGVAPAGGPVAGGTTVTVTGSGFTGATAVNFGTIAIAASDFTVKGDTEITVTAPATGPTPQPYLRVWQATAPAVFGQSIPLVTALGVDTGLSVTLSSTLPAGRGPGAPSHVGDFWRFALRPIQPGIVYPARYLASPQPPDGPRTWAAPLAVLTWVVDSATTTSCVLPFWSLVQLTTTVISWAAQPVVTAVSPSIGPTSGGTEVTVSGSGFFGASAVAFGTNNGSGLTVNSSGTQITVTSPAGTGTVDVVVTSPTGTSAVVTVDKFAYLGVTGLSPSSGPAAGGTPVTVEGSGFTGATAVNFGPNAGTALTPISDSQLTVTSPPGSGTVDVVVTTPLGTSPTVAGGQYTYGPVVTSIAPGAGGASGGELVNVFGSGFTAATAVDFGTAAGGGLSVISDAQITVIAPAGSGTVDVTVTTPGGTSPTVAADQYTYIKGKEAKEKEFIEKFPDHVKTTETVAATSIKATEVKTTETKITDKTTDIKARDTLGGLDLASSEAPRNVAEEAETEATSEQAATGAAFISPQERPAVGADVLNDEQDKTS